MDIKKIVNIFCLIIGLAVIAFGLVIKSGMIQSLNSGRFLAPIFLGFIIVLWSAVSLYRNR